MKFLIIAVILLLTNGFAAAQKLSPNEFTVRVKDRKLSVKHGKKNYPLAIGADAVAAEKITEAEILFSSRKNDFLYLVLAVSGQSRAQQNDRQCGAGIESNLIWLKLDAAWKISEVNSARYESCWAGINSDESYKVNGDLLTVEFDDFREDVNVKLSYHNREPEKGFQLTRTPLAKN